ncbi:MAG TPA: ABC transporter ATP-binding protein [Thermodesulfobacteriota bacterium]|nr:ABC transporter ATP-binding protein [Thermodesulfobacteriota bacterium]
MAAILAIDGLTKNFGGLRAVDSVSLQFEEGKLTSVIGPNGAGKTTFFNLLTGLIKPDLGKIIFKGEDITKLPIHGIVRKGISRSFQIINLFNEMTLLENVWLGVQAQQGHGVELFADSDGFRSIRDETFRVIKETGLTGKEETPVKLLSYGDRRILEITLSLTAKPSLLLLDEPTSGLVSDDRKRISKFMKELSSQLTLVVVEHDMDIVLSISDHIVVMYQGKILAQGTPDEIRRSDKVQEAYLGGQYCLA